MRIAVIGAGGVGGYFGGRLAQAGVDVTFLARGRTLDALRTRGLRVESIKGDFELPSVQASDDPSAIGPVDFVLVTVKAWQIAEAARSIPPLLGPDTAVVPLENGLEAHDQLVATLGREHVLAGLCGLVSFVVEPGHIRHIGVDPMVMFGELDNVRSPRVERLLAAFTSAVGLQADVPPSIHRSLWSKFLFIAPLSGIGAVTRVPPSVWRVIPETRALAIRAMEEIIAVATARGIELAPNALQLTLDRYDALPPDATASMQRDVMEGKPSELDAQLGAIVRLGRESGVATPVFEMLYHVLLPQEQRARASV